MKLVIYARVSSQEQVSGYSLDAQTDLCKKWADEHGHEAVRVFVEMGKSARTDNRPAFQSAIGYVLAGGADGVLVHKSDRFARNLLDYLIYWDKLKEKGKRILSVSEEFLNDDSDASRFVAKLIAATAEYVSDTIGKEAQKGRNQKAKSGSWPGSRPPFGYVRNNKQIVPHAQYANFIRTAFREFATGRYTLATWANQAIDMGILSEAGKKILPSVWQRLFRNKLYTGRFDHLGEEIIGDHAAIITIDEFNRVQELLTEKDSGGKVARHFWLLAGLLWSKKQKSPMNGSLAKGKYPYYRAKEHYVSAHDLEARVENLLKNCRGFTDDAPENLLIAMKVAPNLGEIYEQFASKHAKRDFLRLIFLDNGLIVSWGGAIIEAKFKEGFRFIEGSSRS